MFAACRKKKAAAELRERKQNYKKSLDNLRDKQTQLEQVRSERVRLFTGCFEHISAEIDSIYKVRCTSGSYVFLMSCYSSPRSVNMINLLFLLHNKFEGQRPESLIAK